MHFFNKSGLIIIMIGRILVRIDAKVQTYACDGIANVLGAK
jgi:hypothetical protein